MRNRSTTLAYFASTLIFCGVCTLIFAAVALWGYANGPHSTPMPDAVFIDDSPNLAHMWADTLPPLTVAGLHGIMCQDRMDTRVCAKQLKFERSEISFGAVVAELCHVYRDAPRDELLRQCPEPTGLARLWHFFD